MAITSLDTYLAATKQFPVVQKKSASMTSVALMLTDVIAQSGIPGAGTLAGTDATTGILQTDAIAGYPTINAFGGSVGYLTRVSGYNSVAGTIILADVLLKMGTFAYNASTSGLTSASISTRVPASSYQGLELWFIAVTAFTGNPVVTVTYLDQDGNAGTTGAFAPGYAPIVGRGFRMPLAAGDSGIRTITGVTCGTATVGTFNLMIVRPLVQMRIPYAGYREDRDIYGTGCPQIYADSALGLFVIPDSTATGLPEFAFEIANS
jgi:hypothetical protein